MIKIEIKEKKEFMQCFLNTKAFDSFLLKELKLTTYNTFTIDGRIHKNYYDTAQAKELETEDSLSFSSWENMRPIVYDLIKGKRLPLQFHIVLYLSPSHAETLLKKENAPTEAVEALACNIQFSSNTLYVTTGVAYKSFTMDKTVENIWDETMEKFLNRFV